VNTAEALAAIISPNAVVLTAVLAAWRLLRQGDGLQLRTPPAPTKKQLERALAAEKAAPVEDLNSRRAA
jgi:hypothetical protein